MTVNGRPRWTYRTHVSRVVENGRLEIAPLAKPVIKDLATDMRRFSSGRRPWGFVPSGPGMIR